MASVIGWLFAAFIVLAIAAVFLRVVWFIAAFVLLGFALVAVAVISVTFSVVGWTRYLLPSRARSYPDAVLRARDRSTRGLRWFADKLAGSADLAKTGKTATTQRRVVRRRWFVFWWH